MKTCSKCGEEKSLDSFSKNRAQSDGLCGHCKPCIKEYRKSYNQRKHVKEASRKAGLKHYYANREKRAAENRDFHIANREAISASKKKYRAENCDAIRDSRRKHRKENPDLYNVRSTKRRAAKLQRTPSWANEQLIAAYYKEAKRLEELTGIKFHVDHIIPLQGEMVSGLHVETNLQLLPAHENIGKSNSFDPETFAA
jgi:hypothetical protein